MQPHLTLQGCAVALVLCAPCWRWRQMTRGFARLFPTMVSVRHFLQRQDHGAQTCKARPFRRDKLVEALAQGVKLLFERVALGAKLGVARKVLLE